MVMRRYGSVAVVGVLAFVAAAAEEEGAASVDGRVVDTARIEVREGRAYILEPSLFTGTAVAWQDPQDRQQKRYERTYVDGLPHGVWTEWYADGAKARSTGYAAGLLHGTEITWDDTGTKVSEEPFDHGKLHGTARSWYPSGSLERSQEWRRGIKSGRFVEWHENGKMARLGNYVAGKLEGLVRTWDENGRPAGAVTYKQGKVVAREQADASGTLEKTLPVKVAEPEDVEED